MDYHGNPDHYGPTTDRPEADLRASVRLDRRLDALLAEPARLREWLSRLALVGRDRRAA